MTEELLKDLTEYQRKQEKPVTAAARSLVMVYRKANPTFLHKRDRVCQKLLYFFAVVAH